MVQASTRGTVDIDDDAGLRIVKAGITRPNGGSECVEGTPASCITSHRNLHTPCIPRHGLVLRIRCPSRCAQQRERRLSGPGVIVTRCEEDAHAPIGPKCPAFMGRASPFPRDLCIIRVTLHLS